MQMKTFSGVWTALITPMNDNGTVNYAELEGIVEAQIEAKIDGLVAVGTTGESPTLNPQEHLSVIDCVCKAARGRVPVLAGTGSNNTLEALHLTKEAEDLGVDGFLIVAPYYNKPSQEGLFLHFGEIAKITEKPIVLYSIPGRCGIEISNDVALRLRDEYPHVRAMKEAGGKADKVADLHKIAGGKIDILSGDDGLAIEFMKRGAKGVISVASNIIPAEMVEMVSAANGGNFDAAQKIEEKLMPLFKNLFIEPNPVPVKFAARLMGLISSDAVRLPLCGMSAESRKTLKGTLLELGLIK